MDIEISYFISLSFYAKAFKKIFIRVGPFRPPFLSVCLTAHTRKD